jgi:tryptophan synthase beta subunit
VYLVRYVLSVAAEDPWPRISMSRSLRTLVGGQFLIDAVMDAAGGHPDAAFMTVGGGSPAANVQVLDPSPEALRKAISERLQSLADDAS